MGLLLPVWWINENNLWSCFEAYSNIVGLLHMLEELSFPPHPLKYWHILGAALLTYSDVSKHSNHIKRGLASSYDLEICTCLLLTSCGSVSLHAFSHLHRTVVTPFLFLVVRTIRRKKKLWQKRKKQTKNPTATDLENALTFFFFFLI